MAKAKKSDTPKAATPRKPSRKPPAKKAAPAAAAQPMIDTDLAAQVTARMLATKAKLGAAAQPEEPGKSSSLIQEIKSSLNKPAAHVVSTSLASTFGEHKHNLPPTSSNPAGGVLHNQTNAGVNRVNVPRRTAG